MSNIPLMYQAQLSGRGQVQYFSDENKPAYQWIEEWQDALSQDCPDFAPPHLVLKEDAKINWRYVSNSGQDETIIRPVIGAKGYPMVTGSSMKGLFKRTCTRNQWFKYCGGETEIDDVKTTKPGQLIFYGGFVRDKGVIDDSAVDIVHEQQDWQVKNFQASHSANIQISLKEPTFTFIIGATTFLTPEEQEEVQIIWHKALSLGLGSRTSAGYGKVLVKSKGTKIIQRVPLSGQGIAPLLPNKQAEFRLNIFKAALRGHTLRLLGGLLDEVSALYLTKKLWGGFINQEELNALNRKGIQVFRDNKPKPIVGYLDVDFINQSSIDFVTREYKRLSNKGFLTRHKTIHFDLEKGELQFRFTNAITNQNQNTVKNFLRQLIQFSLLLGGFGRSWRRADHRIFKPSYKGAAIGCHWSYHAQTVRNLQNHPKFDQLQKIYILPFEIESELSLSNFFGSLNESILDWIINEGIQISKNHPAWREKWNKSNVQVWGLLRENNSSQAIDWFHDDKSFIKKTSLTGGFFNGKLNISRIWHRMYPLHQVKNNILTLQENKYIELLTIFTSEIDDLDIDFIDFLKEDTQFQKVYPA
ncbi:MAG: hypothetical protein WBB82_04855 [Limnothrix sp.]